MVVEDKRQAWEKQKANMERQIKEVREQINKLQHKRRAIVGELDVASDELRAKFVELFDLYVTVHPKKSSGGYHFDITANIPLEMEGNTVSAYDMVFNPSRRGLRG